MRRFLLSALALAFALGILAADRGLWGTGPALQAGLALLGIGCCWPRARASLAVVIAFAAGAASLATNVETSRRVRPNHSFDAVVEGRVCGASSGPGWISRDLCHASNQGVAGFARQSVPPRIRVTAFHQPRALAVLRAWSTGGRVRARLRIRPLVPLRNPGGRSRRAALVRRGIGARASLVAPPLAVNWDPGTSTWTSRLPAIGFRDRLGARLSERGRGGALVAAMGVGDRRGLVAGDRDAFRALGVSHLLAISGLHVVAVAALAYFASLACLRRLSALTARFDTRPIAAGVALVGATAYAAIGGWGVALQRAWVCAIVVVGLSILGRRAASREVLSGAALGVLALQPAALFELGAQLSFAATAALLFDPWAGEAVAPNEGEIRSGGRGRRFLGRSLRASATALAATGPILALHGVAVTPAALLANLVLVPVFGFGVLPACLLAVALAGLEAGEVVLQALCVLFDRLLHVLEFLGAALAGLSVGGAPGGVAWSGCAIFAGLTLCARRTRTRLLGSLLSVGALAIPGGSDLMPPYLAVLDVGRGDAIVLRGPEAAVLVDGGAAFRAGRDRGSSVVVPALEALGIEKLDVVIGSHADLDHRGGLPTVVRTIEVGEIWVPAGESDGGFEELRRAARERGVPVFEKVAGDTAQLPGDVSLSTVWPVQALAQGSRNDRSLVTRIEIGGVAVLLPGDVGFSAERAMLKQEFALDSHVLVLPHHGSANSLSAEFLEVVSPEVTVVSAPCEETSRLPARTTLQRVRRHGAPVWWTGRDGAVVVSLRKPLSAWGWRQDSAAERCRWHGANGSAGAKAHGAFPGTSPIAGRPRPIRRRRTVR